jgi:pentatricopeptide repeat protein
MTAGTSSSTATGKSALRISKYFGVAWNKKAGKWRAQIIRADGSKMLLGDFDGEEAAARAYDELACVVTCALARPLNFPKHGETRRLKFQQDSASAKALDDSEAASSLLRQLRSRVTTSTAATPWQSDSSADSVDSAVEVEDAKMPSAEFTTARAAGRNELTGIWRDELATGNQQQQQQPQQPPQQKQPEREVVPSTAPLTSVYAWSAQMYTCLAAGEWEQALDTLASMTRNGFTPNATLVDDVLRVCEEHGQWERAMKIFDEVDGRKITEEKTEEAPFMHCGGVIGGGEGGGVGWSDDTVDFSQEEVDDFHFQQEHEQQKEEEEEEEEGDGGGEWRKPTTAKQEVGSATLERPLELLLWDRKIIEMARHREPARDVLGVLDQMEQTGFRPDAMTLRAALRAFKRTKNWQCVLDLYDSLQQRNVAADEVIFNFCLKACANLKFGRKALALLDEMEELGVEVDEEALLLAAGAQGQTRMGAEVVAALQREAESRGFAGR